VRWGEREGEILVGGGMIGGAHRGGGSGLTVAHSTRVGSGGGGGQVGPRASRPKREEGRRGAGPRQDAGPREKGGVPFYFPSPI
jgi:hypothetical protein